MLQQNSSEIYVSKMIFLVIFFTITFPKGQHLLAHIFLESVSSCICKLSLNLTEDGQFSLK